MVYYLSCWFPHSYQARLTAGFMAASPFAFIIGGPLASFLMSLDGLAGFRGWQWLFLLEGVPPCLLAFAVLRLLPDTPREASWLSAEEKDFIARAMALEAHKTETVSFRAALADPRVWVLGFCYMAVSAGGYGFRIWLPLIVQGMGFSDFATGFVVAVPYVFAMVLMIWWGRSSDTTGERVWHVVLPMLLGAGGFLLAASIRSDAAVLLGLTAVVIGLDAVIGPFWSLPSAFLRGSAAAAGFALINTFSTGLGGFLGGYVIGILKEQTGGYEASMLLFAGALIVSSAVLTVFVRAMLSGRSEIPASPH